ncbi:MAG: 6-phosphogluconolactonase [Pseudomonadota bacterium]
MDGIHMTDGNTLAELVWHEYDSRSELSNDLAARIANLLSTAQANYDQSIVAFSGGSTPQAMFQALAKESVNWSKTLMTLVDERWVAPDHDLSNQRFITENLLNQLSPQPRFAPLYFADENPAKSLTKVAQGFDQMVESSIRKTHFDAVVLGMGGDGHTASFFPDAENIETLVTYDSARRLETCESPTTQVARVTWSLSALLDSAFLALHITGKDKRGVLEGALALDNASLPDLAALPIRSVLFQQKLPLHIFYAD